MKSVLISDTAPLYPPLWGGPKRIWNIYNNFSKDLFDLTYVGVTYRLGNDIKYSFNKIRENFKQILCVLPPYYYPWHAIEQAIFKNTTVDLFIYLNMHTDWQFRYILNSQSTDIVICSHPWSSLCIKKEDKQFFIYDAHNCEYLLIDQILGKHLLKRLVLSQVKKIERDACKKSDLILVCSNEEKEDFIDLYKVIPEKIIIVPNGARIIEEHQRKTKESCRQTLSISPKEVVIIFIGTYYKPNIDAARFIIEKIAPALSQFKFIIVGTSSEAFRKDQISSNILLLGRVSDQLLDWALSASDIAINPMFDGSGVNIKMLDYMSYGLPIVTTECGARGIETFGRQPMIVSSIENFVENIKILTNDSILYKQMSEDARILVVEHYDWEKISTKLQNILLERLK
jgi:glycosyltransferase involved in cell wall biosynthesis